MIAMVNVVTIAASSAGSEAQADRLGPPGTVLHSSYEPGELSQWQCHDDSTIKIVVAVTVTKYDVRHPLIARQHVGSNFLVVIMLWLSDTEACLCVCVFISDVAAELQDVVLSALSPMQSTSR